MAKTKDKVKAILVSHTHWDRAWYLPFEAFRFRLVGLIDRVIELLNGDPNFKCFVLDGQTVLIEDYLEIKPEKKEELIALIRNKRLVIGPWYVLPDLFLVSGESIIRNLQYGDRMCREFGGGLDVGYVPDPFGHIAQLPQILNGFDIDTFIFMRGMPEELAEKKSLLFHWKSPGDTGSVLAYYLRDGYYNAAALGYDGIQGRYDVDEPDSAKARESIEKTKSVLTDFHPKELILLNNGVDHMPEQPEIPQLIAGLNQNGSDVEIEHGSFSDFMNEAKKVNVTDSYQGNLLGNPDHPILSSVYSTRVYLKQQNHAAQSLLEKYVEPLLLLAGGSHVQNYGRFLDHAWKLLLKNHPHDDICGCSTDSVHDENEVQFQRVMEIGHSLIDSVLEELSITGFQKAVSKLPAGKKSRVLLFNPHPFRLENQTIETEVHFGNPDGREEEYTLPETGLRAFNSRGEEIPISISGSNAPVLKAEYIQHTWGRRYSITCSADLPAAGYEMITVVAEESSNEIKKEKQAGSTRITNDRASLELKNGSIHYKNSAENVELSGLIAFEYTLDEGDTYSYSPVDGSGIILKDAEASDDQSADERLAVTYNLAVPASLESEEKVTIAISVFFKLRGDGSVAIRVEYENRAENGRLRMILPAMGSAEKSYSENHFYICENGKRKYLKPENNAERYNNYPGELNYTTHYQGDFCYTKEAGIYSFVANRGLHEYELMNLDGKSAIAVTLHRSVGYLSVANGKIRRPQAGPSIETPGAQCKRNLKADLCWGIASGDSSEMIQSAKLFSHPPMAREMPHLDNLPESGDIKRELSIVKIENPNILLSAIKRAEDGRDIILRCYNVTDVPQSTQIEFELGLSRYCESSLFEEWVEEHAGEVADNKFAGNFSPHEIKTYRLVTL